MAHKQQDPRLKNIPARPIHAEENRLAKRLFQLERRVDELENKVQEMNEMLAVLIGVDDFGEDGENGICFCTCDEDDL